MLRWLFMLVLLCTSMTAVHASDAIVFISPADAGPEVDPGTSSHPDWVLWPPATSQNGSNRLLSIRSGRDWSSSGISGALVETRDGWQLPNLIGLGGYFAAVRDRERSTHPSYIALARADGSVAPVAVLLSSTSSGIVLPRAWSAQIQAHESVIFGARTWDEIQLLERRVTGAVVIVEYPPPAGASWSRVWMRAHGRSVTPIVNGDRDIPAIRGLILARELGRLGGSNSAVPSQSEDASRFLMSARYLGPVARAIWAGVAALALTFAAICIMREQSSRLAQFGLFFAALLGPSIFVASELSALTSWNALPIFALVLCLVTTALVWAISERRGENEKSDSGLALLTGVSLLTLGSAILFEPVHSIFTGLFAEFPAGYSPEACGLILGSAILFCASTQLWVLKACLIAAVAAAWLGLRTPGIATDAHWLLLALLIGSNGKFRPAHLGYFVLCIPISALTHHEPTYVGQLSQNYLLDLLLSPIFFTTLFLAGGVTLFGNRFIVHLWRRLATTRPAYGAMARTAGLSTVVAVVMPVWLYPALLAAFYCLGAILFGCLREL